MVCVRRKAQFFNNYPLKNYFCGMFMEKYLVFKYLFLGNVYGEMPFKIPFRFVISTPLKSNFRNGKADTTFLGEEHKKAYYIVFNIYLRFQEQRAHINMQTQTTRYIQNIVNIYTSTIQIQGEYAPSPNKTPWGNIEDWWIFHIYIG